MAPRWKVPAPASVPAVPRRATPRGGGSGRKQPPDSRGSGQREFRHDGLCCFPPALSHTGPAPAGSDLRGPHRARSKGRFWIFVGVREPWGRLARSSCSDMGDPCSCPGTTLSLHSASLCSPAGPEETEKAPDPLSPTAACGKECPVGRHVSQRRVLKCSRQGPVPSQEERAQGPRGTCCARQTLSLLRGPSSQGDVLSRRRP